MNVTDVDDWTRMVCDLVEIMVTAIIVAMSSVGTALYSIITSVNDFLVIISNRNRVDHRSCTVLVTMTWSYVSTDVVLYNDLLMRLGTLTLVFLRPQALWMRPYW